MKKILYILCSLFALTSCQKEELQSNGGQNADGTYTFNLGIEEPDYTPKSRAAVAMDRYVMEIYEGDLTATPTKQSNATGVFNVEMKKDTDYVCLFWADNGTDYIATDLKAVKQTDETKLGTAAYATKVTVNSKTFNGAVTLKRAVAELSFIYKSGLSEPTNSLKIIYPYASATLNVGDGTVTYATGSALRTIESIVPPADKATAFASDFVLAPTAAGVIRGLKFKLNSEAKTTIAETIIQANYRTKITGEFVDVGPMPSMKFTIDTRKNLINASDNTFILPLQASLSGYSLTVDWGDANTDTFDSGTTLAQANMTHIYAVAGVYTITISSSQKDVSEVQIPKLNFYNNYSSTNNNTHKLTSLDSPMLNMGADLSDCFDGCQNLTSIPSGLFANNTLATNFSYCFYGCAGLTSIPEGLFSNNTQATNFFECFYNCRGLTSIPAGLFANNALVTSFSECFYNCAGLTGAIPAGLFANNTQATNFMSCFTNCTGLTGAIPAGLFENNAQATNFSYCFRNCTGLTLNANIFCDEATGAATRFAGKVMDFRFCFFDCGKDISITDGGTAPTLWLYTMEPSSIKAGCFDGVTKVTNVADIPVEWK